MRILFVTPRFPHPPNRGDTLRSWHILTALAQRHEIWLASIDHTAPSEASAAAVNRLCKRVAVFVRSPVRSLIGGLWSLASGAPLTTGYFHDGRLAEVLAEWSGDVDFDAALVYSSALSRSLSGLRVARRVLDLGDVDSVKWETYARRSIPPLRWLYQLEATRLAAVEAELCARHDTVVVVNERERRKLERRVAGVHAGVAPTSVDASAYAEIASAQLPDEPVVGFIGSLFYPPNERAVLWFAQYVWPHVRARIPEARWLIVGARPGARVRRLAQRKGVVVTGSVDDVLPYLRAMRVFVGPVDGDLGVQSKLIVAMAAGRPSVVTPDTAAGIVALDPPPFLIAGSPRGFADAVVRLLRDSAQARALAARARRVAIDHYGVESVGRDWERWLAGTKDMERPQSADRYASVTDCETLETAVVP